MIGGLCPAALEAPWLFVEAATGLHDQQLEVRIERAGGAGSAVTVTVVYHDSAAIPLVRWLMPSVIDLTARATMRQESG